MSDDTTAPTVLLVDTAPVAARLATRLAETVAHVDVAHRPTIGEATAAVAEDRARFDCLVVGPGAGVTTDAIARLRTRFQALPVVVGLAPTASVGPVAALEAGATDVVTVDPESEGWLTLLALRIDPFVPGVTPVTAGSGTGADGSDGEGTDAEAGTAPDRHVGAVGSLVETLGGVESVDSAHAETVTAAPSLFDAEAAVVATREDGAFVVCAGTGPNIDLGEEPLTAGLAGRTLDAGETLVIDDLPSDPDVADGVHYRSALSVPLGDATVFQVLTTRPAAFDHRCRETAELVASALDQTRDRIEATAAVERERDRFAALFQNIPDAGVRYVVEDGAPHIEAVNSAFVRLFGYDLDAAIGATTVDLLGTDERAEAAEDDTTAGAAAAAVVAGERFEREGRRRTADGVRPFLVRNVPVSAGEGYLIYSDIGEIVERERALERKNERLDAFASIVSHDLRNPLAIATGLVDIARESDDPEVLDDIAAELDRMDAIISDMLRVARQGTVVKATEPASANAFLALIGVGSAVAYVLTYLVGYLVYPAGSGPVSPETGAWIATGMWMVRTALAILIGYYRVETGVLGSTPMLVWIGLTVVAFVPSIYGTAIHDGVVMWVPWYAMLVLGFAVTGITVARGAVYLVGAVVSLAVAAAVFGVVGSDGVPHSLVLGALGAGPVLVDAWRGGRQLDDNGVPVVDGDGGSTAKAGGLV